MTAIDARQIGTHFVQCGPRDLVYLVFDGDVSPGQARELNEFVTEATRGRSCRILIDVRGLGDLAADARRELITPRPEARRDRSVRRIQIAFVGGSTRARVLMTVTVAAAQAVNRTKLSSIQFETMAEALAWAKIDAKVLRRPSSKP